MSICECKPINQLTGAELNRALDQPESFEIKVRENSNYDRSRPHEYSTSRYYSYDEWKKDNPGQLDEVMEELCRTHPELKGISSGDIDASKMKDVRNAYTTIYEEMHGIHVDGNSSDEASSETGSESGSRSESPSDLINLANKLAEETVVKVEELPKMEETLVVVDIREQVDFLLASFYKKTHLAETNREILAIALQHFHEMMPDDIWDTTEAQMLDQTRPIAQIMNIIAEEIQGSEDNIFVVTCVLFQETLAIANCTHITNMTNFENLFQVFEKAMKKYA